MSPYVKQNIILAHGSKVRVQETRVFLHSILKLFYSLSQRWKQNIYSVQYVLSMFILCGPETNESFVWMLQLSALGPFFSRRLTKVQDQNKHSSMSTEASNWFKKSKHIFDLHFLKFGVKDKQMMNSFVQWLVPVEEPSLRL